MKIRNLTPHPINIGMLTIPPDQAGPARCEESAKPTIGQSIVHDGVTIPVKNIKAHKVVSLYNDPAGVTVQSRVIGLPPKEDGVFLIVSRAVAMDVADIRDDILIPGDQVRDQNGRVVGCECLLAFVC